MNFNVSMPEWAIAENGRLPEFIVDPIERMRVVIEFSRLNFQNDTGGPFAAGVFEIRTGRVVVIGVNRVVPCNISAAHAEMVALSIAQTMLQTFDLGGPGIPDHELVVNARPCAMCFGAIPWSGIRALSVAVPGERIEELTGFDEGPIHPQWKSELLSRGIKVTEDVLVEQASHVLSEFGKSNRTIYNGRRT